MRPRQTPWVLYGILMMVALGALFVAAFIIAWKVAVTPQKKAAQEAAATPKYVRLVVPAGRTYYVQFRKDTMRMAASVEGLKQVAPTMAADSMSEEARFPAVALSAASSPSTDSLPKVRFELMRLGGVFGGPGGEPVVFGSLDYTQKDKEGSGWSYSLDINGQTGDKPETAPEIKVPQSLKPRLEVVAKPERRAPGVGLRALSAKAKSRALGVGLRVLSDGQEVSRIRKEGVDAQAKLRIIGGDGKVVASTQGTLDKFGFG
jgi:hypothetical protein